MSSKLSPLTFLVNGIDGISGTLNVPMQNPIRANITNIPIPILLSPT